MSLLNLGGGEAVRKLSEDEVVLDSRHARRWHLGKGGGDDANRAEVGQMHHSKPRKATSGV